MEPSKQSEIQNVVAKIRGLLLPKPNSSNVGPSTTDRSTQCSMPTIVPMKDWDDISASTVYARRTSLVNMLVNIIKAVSN